MYVCMYVCVCMYMYVCAGADESDSSNARTHARTHARARDTHTIDRAKTPGRPQIAGRAVWALFDREEARRIHAAAERRRIAVGA
jgi:hypothetical protein